jgi:hypothetical protein
LINSSRNCVRPGSEKRAASIVAACVSLLALTATDMAAADMSSYCPDTTPDITARADVLRLLKRPHVQQLAEGLDLTAYESQNDLLGTYKKTDGRRVDWILVSGNLTFSRYEVLPDIVSDHLAVYAELGLVP